MPGRTDYLYLKVNKYGLQSVQLGTTVIQYIAITDRQYSTVSTDSVVPSIVCPQHYCIHNPETCHDILWQHIGPTLARKLVCTDPADTESVPFCCYTCESTSSDSCWLHVAVTHSALSKASIIYANVFSLLCLDMDYPPSLARTQSCTPHEYIPVWEH